MADNNNQQPGGNDSDYLTIGDFLQKTNTALTNGQGPDIEPLMARRGIDKAMMKLKLQEADQLGRLNEQQRQEYGEQYGATEAYTNARKAAHEDYIDAIQMGRLAFKNDMEALTALELRGDRAQSQGGYVRQGLNFYNNALANPGYLSVLATKGVTQEDLQAGRTAFMNLKTLSATQQNETGDAQAATRARDAAYDALAAWMGEFYKTARVALRRHPQLMEKLGIVEK